MKPEPPLPMLDAAVIANRIEFLSRAWGWDDWLTNQILGKLARGNPAIGSLDREKAATIIEQCREGVGLHFALKETRVTIGRYFAWIAKSWSDDPDSGLYRQFRMNLVATFAERAAAMGGSIDDLNSQRQLRELGLVNAGVES